MAVPTIAVGFQDELNSAFTSGVAATMRIAYAISTMTLLLGSMTAGANTFASDRPATEILAEIDEIVNQHVRKRLSPAQQKDLRADPTARRKYEEDQIRTQTRRDQLVLELYQVQPDHGRLPQLLRWRWGYRARNPETSGKVLSEIDTFLQNCEIESLKTDTLFARAEVILYKNRRRSAATLLTNSMPAIEDAIARAPTDQRGAGLLYAILSTASDLPDQSRDELEGRLIRNYPQSSLVGLIKQDRMRRESVGKSFELTFSDAIFGKRISIRDLRGKIVVVNFWATWCNSCIAHIDDMKLLYNQYHKKGVEFIGVSCELPEDGGLDRLKEFVVKNEIPWPQYYQGGMGEGTFADRWGVRAIPAIFVIDTDGNVASSQANGKLDELIPKMLKMLSKGKEVKDN